MELNLQLPHGDHLLSMLGPAERNLKLIREALSISITSRNKQLRLSGASSAVGQAVAILEQLSNAAKHHRPWSRQQLLDALADSSHNPAFAPSSTASSSKKSSKQSPDTLDVYTRGRPVKPITPGQRQYLHAILNHDLTFCIGPAGTGKTYLAVAAAVSLLKSGRIRKLVLVRPAVEAGERLGFLPGDMQAKVNPYLRPLLDALHDVMDFEQIQRFMAVDVMEIIPLAFMRGRTLNDSLIILDEAQNTTKQQMLMFLTRLGTSSKMVITGDTTQIDLPDPRQSGLIDAVTRIQNVPGIATITLQRSDIVRHPLVQQIVTAYDTPSTSRPSRSRPSSSSSSSSQP